MGLAAALAIALALPASAQMYGPPGPGGPMGGERMGPGFREDREGRMMSHEGPLITIMLEHSQELGLTLEQQQKLRDLRTQFSKESVRRTAEIRLAEIELDTLLEQDQWDLSKIEAKVKQIAALQGDLRLARVKTLAAGRAVLTPQQLENFKQVGHRMRLQGGPGSPGPGMMGPGPYGGPGMRGPGGPPAPRQ